MKTIVKIQSVSDIITNSSSEVFIMEAIVTADFKEIIDWSKVEVDTHLMVRDKGDKEWVERFFAKYEDGKVYCWHDGMNSIELDGNTQYTRIWDEAEIAYF
jgi:hypothetical protein